MLFPSNLYTNHMGQRGNKLSPRLWSRALKRGVTPDGSGAGLFLYDDFESFPNLTVTTAAGQLQPPNGYFAYIEADATVGSIRQNTGDPSVITLLTSTDAADGNDHDTTLATNYNVGSLGKISDTAGDAKLTIVEFRFRLNSVTNGDGSIFLGLGEEGLAAANTPLVTDTTHKLSSDDLIGFTVLENDNDALLFQYRKNGAAIQTVLTYGTALAADTWYNAGFVYDPSAPDSQQIAVYINNEEQSTYVTAAQIAASTFPDGENLAMYASIKGSADNDPQHFDLDFWAFYQEA